MSDQIQTTSVSLVDADSKEVAFYAARVLEEKKGMQIALYDARLTAPFTDYFLVVTGRSVTHIQSLAHDLSRKLAEAGITDCRIEGRGSDTWVLLDYSDFVVHIFSREAREFYHIDRLFPAESHVSLPEFLPHDEET